MLSKKVCLLLTVIFFGQQIFAQQQTGEPSRGSEDYKDPEQHEKFAKRRKIVSAWQINQLKQGALVVRLRTNKLAVDELKKAGHNDQALQKELETFAINKTTMIAFRDHFNFCKVYFVPSNFSDSLLKGAKSGIFLDTNLAIDPSITMQENFYLIAERDYGYNSSIGFVPQDSANKVQEKGNAVKQMAFVIKNKYGHQLKNPFPYAVGEKNFMNEGYTFPISVNPNAGGNKINFYVNKTYLYDLDNTSTRQTIRHSGTNTVKIGKQFTYEKLSDSVLELTDNLRSYHQGTPPPEGGRLPEDVKPFLY